LRSGGSENYPGRPYRFGPVGVTDRILKLLYQARGLKAGQADRARLIAPLIEIPGVTLHQHGDAECTVTFPTDNPAIFEQVARILKPYVKRQVSEAERQRSAETSAQYGYKPSSHQ
jgi:hypothetical protein